jgi:hypothetical protein
MQSPVCRATGSPSVGPWGRRGSFAENDAALAGRSNLDEVVDGATLQSSKDDLWFPGAGGLCDLNEFVRRASCGVHVDPTTRCNKLHNIDDWPRLVHFLCWMRRRRPVVNTTSQWQFPPDARPPNQGKGGAEAEVPSRDEQGGPQPLAARQVGLPYYPPVWFPTMDAEMVAFIEECRANPRFAARPDILGVVATMLEAFHRLGESDPVAQVHWAHLVRIVAREHLPHNVRTMQLLLYAKLHIREIELPDGLSG